LLSSGGTGWILTAVSLGVLIAIDRTQPQTLLQDSTSPSRGRSPAAGAIAEDQTGGGRGALAGLAIAEHATPQNPGEPARRVAGASTTSAEIGAGVEVKPVTSANQANTSASNSIQASVDAA
jgi:hypothetical protein